MKLATSTIHREGDLTGHNIKMRIDAAATAHVMQALINLYSNNEQAVLREISTNARDAHIDAGIAHLPIEVHLPTQLDPYLRITDRGYGLSQQDIEDIYSAYGASTKRDTNEQVGSLGFGCKSPLAYTDQFTLTSTKDGRTLQVLVSRDEDGGNMQIVSDLETNEPSGVTVEVPVARYHNFEREAKKLFRFWEPGTVLVNGVEPQRIEGRVISDTMMIIDDFTSYIVMGNVPYPVDSQLFPIELNAEHGLVARVPIGSVEFAPSRERLRPTKLTRATLDRVLGEFSAAIQTAVQAAVDKCETRPEVIATILDWRRSLPESRVKGNYTYKGETVPHIYEVPTNVEGKRLRAITSPSVSNKLSARELRDRLDLSWWPKNLFVTEYDRDTFTPTQKKKLLKYAEEKGLQVGYFILLREKPKRSFTKWLDKTRIVKFEVIDAIKLPRSQNGSRAVTDRIPGSYDMYKDGVFAEGVEAHTIDQTAPVFYYVGKAIDCNTDGLVNGSHAKCSIVFLTPNRVEKFLRNFPQATPLGVEARRLFTAWVGSLTANKKAWVHIHMIEGYYLTNNLKPIDTTRIADPALKRAVRLVNKDMPEIRKRWSEFARPLYALAREKDTFKFENPLNTYPLYDSKVLREDPDHGYLYLNAIYSYLQKLGK